jgi:hypothetical protein
MPDGLDNGQEVESSPGQALFQGMLAGTVVFLLGALGLAGLLNWGKTNDWVHWGVMAAAGVAALKSGASLLRAAVLAFLASLGAYILQVLVGTVFLTWIFTGSPGAPTQDTFMEACQFLEIWNFLFAFLLIALGALFGMMKGPPSILAE